MIMGQNHRKSRENRGRRHPACDRSNNTGVPSDFPLPVPPPKHGAALIVTLLVLVLLVVIITGFLSATRVEQMASRNYTYQNQAQQMAMTGVQKALTQLNAATINLADVENFVSQPGRILVMRGTNISTNQLYSSNSGTPSVFLNEGSVIHTNTGTTNYRVPTVEVTNDYMGITNIGRYAYWVDDEGTKANLNAMGTNVRGSFYPTNARPYNYTNITGTGVAAFSKAINGGTNGSNDSWPYFFTGGQVGLLGSFTNSTVVNMRHQMAGGVGNLETLLPYMTNSTRHVSLNSKFITTDANPTSEINTIIGKIDRLYVTNKYGRSFTSKYGAGALRQIVANINDWPLGVTKTNTGYGNVDADGIPNQALGLRRSIHLNEIAAAVYYATNTATIQGQLFVGIELVNPYTQPWGEGSEIRLAMDHLTIVGTYEYGAPAVLVTFTNTSPANQILSVVVTNNLPGRSFWTNGAFAVQSTYSVPPAQQPYSNVVVTSVKAELKSVKLLQTNGVADSICDWANANDLPEWTWTNNVALQGAMASPGWVSSLPSGVNWANGFGVAKNDPRVRTFSWNEAFPATTKAWQGVTNAGITLGVNNSVVNFSSGTGVAGVANDPSPGGTDITNHPSFQLGFIAQNADVPYKSVTELGRVHTGLQWRTLWMRSSPITDSPPDWALLETFYLTNNVPKVNVNSVPYMPGIAQNADDFQTAGLLREKALSSLLTGGNTVNAGAAGFTGSEMSAAIMSTVAANVPKAKFDVVSGKPWLTGRGNNNAYSSSLGETLDYSNVSYFTTNDFINENRAGAFIDAVSVASDAFMIYSLGQAFAPGDTNNVVAEYRCRALVRYNQAAEKFEVQMIEPMLLP